MICCLITKGYIANQSWLKPQNCELKEAFSLWKLLTTGVGYSRGPLEGHVCGQHKTIAQLPCFYDVHKPGFVLTLCLMYQESSTSGG